MIGFPSALELLMIFSIAVFHVLVIFKLANTFGYDLSIEERKPITLWALNGMAIVGLFIGSAIIMTGYVSPIIAFVSMIFGLWKAENDENVEGEPLGIVYMTFWIIPIVIIIFSMVIEYFVRFGL